MNQILLIGNGLATFLTGFSPSLTSLEMPVKLARRNIQLTILTILSLTRTLALMHFDLSGSQFLLTEPTSDLLMELFIMLFLVIDIVKLAAVWTLLYIPTTVAEVGCNFGLREEFLAIVALFQRLGHGPDEQYYIFTHSIK